MTIRTLVASAAALLAPLSAQDLRGSVNLNLTPAGGANYELTVQGRPGDSCIVLLSYRLNPNGPVPLPPGVLGTFHLGLATLQPTSVFLLQLGQQTFSTSFVSAGPPILVQAAFLDHSGAFATVPNRYLAMNHFTAPFGGGGGATRGIASHYDSGTRVLRTQILGTRDDRLTIQHLRNGTLIAVLDTLQLTGGLQVSAATADVQPGDAFVWRVNGAETTRQDF